MTFIVNLATLAIMYFSSIFQRNFFLMCVLTLPLLNIQKLMSLVSNCKSTCPLTSAIEDKIKQSHHRAIYYPLFPARHKFENLRRKRRRRRRRRRRKRRRRKRIEEERGVEETMICKQKTIVHHYQDFLETIFSSSPLDSSKDFNFHVSEIVTIMKIDQELKISTCIF